MATSTPRPSVGCLDRRARVVLGEVHGRRAEAAGYVEPRLDGVDGDDLGGARGARGLDGAQPDGPEAEHGNAVARAHRLAAWKPVPITSPAKSATSLAIPRGRGAG